ncbi:hypothetical protein HAHE_09040 [Haloferula helveola]|uniref:Knr4/Smi1-like domain-containing protein n=1 Tax=Haloferula helveola TaxID=490095 RepID=A0ABN6H0F6_9BACT|nr:hypothetical protein HAHE_09040 [Haloferula helveola]
MKLPFLLLLVAITGCKKQAETPQASQVTNNWFFENAGVQAEVPFDFDTGIQFKYWSTYPNDVEKQRVLAAFSDRYGVSLPEDFKQLIGDVVEGGFDGTYQVAMDGENSIEWWRLLSFGDPAVAGAPQSEAGTDTYFAATILEENPSLFHGVDGSLLYVPFGRAYRFGPSDTGTSGFLAFDLLTPGRIVWVATGSDAPVVIGESFRAMLEQSTFLHYG